MLLPFNKSSKKKNSKKPLIVLAGDVGASKTDLALFRFENDQAMILAEIRSASRAYDGIIPLAHSFMKDLPRPDTISLGVAGPVMDGHARLSNINWEIDRDEIADHFSVKSVSLLNDLEATAYGLAMLTEKDRLLLHKGNEAASGNAAVIAPGTGLGEAGLYWDGYSYHPMATEGGHCDFASRNGLDFELFQFLQGQFGHVSWERLVCGPGIVNIFQFLRDQREWEVEPWLNEAFENADMPAVIGQHVIDSAICKETMRLFVRFLAEESANLVLKFKATAGLFIAGGIVPKNISLLEEGAFFSSFCQSGRLNYLLQQVPVQVILNTRTALLGAAYYASEN